VKRLIRWAVMVNDEMFPESLSLTREGAESYLRDAKYQAAKGSRVYVAKIIIERAKGV
jgi:hypothetical protein